MKSIYLHLLDRSVRLFVALGLLAGLLGAPAITSTVSAAPLVQATDTLTPSETPTLGTPTDTPPPSETPTPGPMTDTPTPAVTSTAILMPTASSTTTPTPSATLTASETATPAASPTPTVSTEEAETIEIDPAGGGKLTSKEGWFEIEFPGQAVDKKTQITFKHLPPPVITSTVWVPSQRFEMAAQESDDQKPIKHFQKPAKIKLHLNQLGYQPGQVDGRQLWFGYYDEALQDWVSIPFTLDQTGDKVLVEAETDHFTTFGLGGKADPGWSLKFDEPIVALASGAATFSYPFQIPAGRGGVQPQLALSYSSRNVDHLKGWYQSDWV